MNSAAQPMPTDWFAYATARVDADKQCCVVSLGKLAEFDAIPLAETDWGAIDPELPIRTKTAALGGGFTVVFRYCYGEPASEVLLRDSVREYEKQMRALLKAQRRTGAAGPSTTTN